MNILNQIILKRRADALFLHWKDPSHFYFLGKKLENSYILVRKNKKPILFKSILEDFSSNKFKVVNLKKKGQLSDEINKFKIRNLCVDFNYFTLSQKNMFMKSKLIDISANLLELRAVKRKDELRKISKANKFTADCFNILIKVWKKKKFKMENDVVRFIKEFALKHDVELSFDPIVASGINASIPHHDSKGKLNSGFCVLDFGFDFEGYKADMTRTIYIGKPSEKEINLYKNLLKIQDATIKKCTPGAKCSYLYDFVYKSLGKEAMHFTHGLGHGTGVQIHELPNLKSNSKDVLRENMVITIEPGIYDKKRKLGLRIEDSLIVKNKPQVLTKKATKKLLLV